MDNLKAKGTTEELSEYVITVAEMIKVRGGDGNDPVYIPNPPQTKI